MKARLIGWFSIAMLACTNSSTTNKTGKAGAGDSTAVQNDHPTQDTAFNTQVDGVIILHFDKDSSSLTTTGHLDSAFDKVICYLDVNKGQQLTANVSPETGNGNIRFNQVFMPDGTSDGPFGKTLDYNLKQQGLYQLHIGASMMAENPFIGKFILRVTVK